MPRAYFHIQGLVGDGTMPNAYRPQGLDAKGITGWACSYDSKDKASCFVLVEADQTTLNALPKTAGIVSLAPMTTIKADPVAAKTSVIAVVSKPPLVGGKQPPAPTWTTFAAKMLDRYQDTMVGDWQAGD